MRRVVFWSHFTVASVVGLMVLIKAVTGFALAFERPVTAWADARRVHMAPPPAGTPRWSIEALVNEVRAIRPDARVGSVTVSADPASPVTMSLGTSQVIFVDPYRGAIVGDGSTATRGFFSSVLAWHRWLNVSGTNRAAARSAGAAATLAFFFLILSGVYLWWPRVWSRARLRFSFWFRRGLPVRGRDLNLHHAFGFWSAVPLVVIVATGVVMSYDWANNLLYRAVGDTPPVRAAAAPAPGGGGRRGSARAPRDSRPVSIAVVDRALSHVSEYSPDWSTVSIRMPSAPASALSLTVDAGTGGQPQARGTLTIDATSGAVMRWEPFSNLSAGRQARSLARFLHTGEALGWVGQFIAALAMLGAVVLVWTGFAMAWRRVRLPSIRLVPKVVLPLAALGVAAVVVGWQVFADGDSMPNPVAASHVAWLDITVLVFREGLECVLVLSAITASMTGATSHHRRPVAFGAVAGLAATAITWIAAVRIIDDLALNLPALHVQAATGLLAVIVLLIVMNWFFHKVYWTGWIAAHTNRKRVLLGSAGPSSAAVALGLAVLGFTSLYREGVEVVLFLQSYRMKLGPEPIQRGVAIGLLLTAAVALVTFVLHKRLPYRRMLVATGVMLGVVLLVMVGEQAQEMQLAGWLPRTEIHWLTSRVPSWMGLWFSVFPTVETLAAQALALILVLGSYAGARQHPVRVEQEAGETTPAPSGTFRTMQPMSSLGNLRAGPASIIRT